VKPVRALVKSDLLCFGAMGCVAAGVVLNIVYLQALSSDGASPLVLIPVFAGLAIMLGTPLLRAVFRARHKNWLEALGAGAVVYLAGSAVLSLLLPTLPQPRSGL
jgi:hypothetical protein